MKKGAIILTGAVLVFSLLTLFASSQAVAEEDTIKIGYVASVSGPMGPKIKHMTHGVNLAVKEINDRGGILGGKKVEVILYDPRHVPEEGVSAVRRAIYRDKVKGLVGFDDASVALAAIPVALKEKVPTVNAMAMHPDLVRKPGELGFISVQITVEQLVKAQARFAEESLGIKSIVALGPDNAWLWQNFEDMRKFWGRPGSPVKVLDTIAYPIGETDISPVILKAAGHKPDLVWSFAWGIVDTIQVYRKLTEVGYKGKRMQCLGMLIPPVIEPAGKTIEGAYGVITWEVQLTNPESEAFKKALVDAFGPQIMAETSDVTAVGYMSTKGLLLAMEKAGSATDLKAIDKAFFELDWVTPLGSKWQLEKDGRLVWREVSISQVNNGQVEVVKTIPRSE
jgi:branched-chain amino acid transport system substrate-binding protein